MVQLDYQLLYTAEHLMTGANVHQVTELMFAYPAAVALHNTQQPRHEIYRIQSELHLRNYVHKCQGEVMRQEAATAKLLARVAQTRFDSSTQLVAGGRC